MPAGPEMDASKPGSDAPQPAPALALTIGAEDKGVMARMRRAWLQLAGVFMARTRNQRMQAFLTALKNKRLNVAPPPAKPDIKRIVALASRKVATLDLPFH